MADFNSILSQKYSILQQHANDQGMLERANANLADQNAGQVAANAAAARGLQGAQAQRLGVESQMLPGQTAADIAAKRSAAGHTDMQSRLAPQIAQSAMDLQRTQGLDNTARAGLTQSQIGMTNAQTEDINSGLRSPLSAVNAAGDAWQQGRMLRPNTPPAQWPYNYTNFGGGYHPYSGGTSKVPGHGDGTVDKVPAMLAPGEAVLNKGAAEHVGRGLISHLNAIGAAKMGMTGPGEAGKLAKGTSKVAKGKASDTPSITPQMLQALMQQPQSAPQGAPAPGGGGGLMAMLQQGGGMV